MWYFYRGTSTLPPVSDRVVELGNSSVDIRLGRERDHKYGDTVAVCGDLPSLVCLLLSHGQIFRGSKNDICELPKLFMLTVWIAENNDLSEFIQL